MDILRYFSFDDIQQPNFIPFSVINKENKVIPVEQYCGMNLEYVLLPVLWTNPLVNIPINIASQGK